MTIRELAEIAGVSASTVSNVINNRGNISDETRLHVKSIIEKYNYKVKKKRTVKDKGSIIFLKYRTHGKAVNENQGFIASIVDHIQKQCSKFKYDLHIINASPQNIREEIENINRILPAGVIFLGTEYLTGKDSFVKDIKVPFVVLDNSLRNEEQDSILMDNRRISIQSVNYLYEIGCRKIGYIKSNLEIDNLTERYIGYIESMHALGLKPMEPITLTPTLMEAYNELSEKFDKIDWSNYDALVCNFDSLAIASIRVLQENGIKVPDDISVIGVDDIPYSSMVVPALTTIKISRSALAYYVVDQLIKRIEGLDSPKVTIKIMGELIARESTKK